MLYDWWRDVARKHAGELALRDAASGSAWTFAQLASAAERHGAGTGDIAYPQGIGAEFILHLLAAWREGKAACPLEAGQVVPVELNAAARGQSRLPHGIHHLKTTSATTGAARLVALTANQLKADADNIVATMGLRPEWPNLGAISLAHSYGFANLVLPLLLHGIPLILVPAPLPESIRAAAHELEALTLAAVPALWRVWHEANAIPENTRLAISAGAPLPLPLERAVYDARRLKIHNFLGASECGGMAYDHSEAPRTDPSSVGWAMMNVELSRAEGGCLHVRSGAVAQTYWPEPAAALANGCFQTNDLVELIDGQIFLRGRAGDQINIAGRKLSPEMIERALLAHPDVRECMVFGAPSNDVERGETVVACVAGTGCENGEKLRQFLLTTLPAWQVPREWWFVESMEANLRGKLSRADWRRRYLERKTA